MNKNEFENLEAYLENPEVVEAIILGTLQKNFNAIHVGKYNKFAVEFNLDKQNKKGLSDILAQIKASPFLSGVYQASMTNGVDVLTLRQYRQQQDTKSLFSTVSSYVVDNTQVLANNREFNKIQREGAYLNHLVDGLKEHLAAELRGIATAGYTHNIKVRAKSQKEMILCLSDWHIGALTNNIDTGGYNFEIFKQRLDALLKETLRIIKEQAIHTVHVYHIGDIIEHINMRNVNQAFEAEFPATEQIAKGVRILAETLNTIAKTGVTVKFGMTGGNHDRFQGNKNDKIYNDNVAYLVVDQLFFLQELGGLQRNIELIDNRQDVYSVHDVVAGKTIKVIHGDNEAKKTDVKIPRHIKTEPIDYLIMGHIHTTRIIQEDFSRFHVYVGSPMGANNYSTENNLPTTSPAQLIMVLDPDADAPMFMPVFL